MKIIKVKIAISSKNENSINCLATNNYTINEIQYSLLDKKITFAKENSLSEQLRKNKFQLNKVLSSAIKGNIPLGKNIQCIFIEDFPFLNSEEYKNYLRLDQRNNKLNIYSSEIETSQIYRVYCDGSYLKKTNQSAYGGFIEDAKGNTQNYSNAFTGGSSNLMELLAVTKGIELLKNQTQIQVNTDSRFVIRGMLQWVHFWRHNNWQTAFGTPVKFAKEWKTLNQLCEGKLIEFKWIKGHSGNEKQDFCHKLAQKTAHKEK